MAYILHGLDRPHASCGAKRSTLSHCCTADRSPFHELSGDSFPALLYPLRRRTPEANVNRHIGSRGEQVLSTFPIRILYIGMRYDGGDKNRGACYEFLNFYDSLCHLSGVEVSHFPFDVVMRERGRKGMNEQLLRTVDENAPHVCFFVLHTDEISPQTLRRITTDTGAVTLNWFGDDHWRFKTFSRYWAPLFHWVVTTHSEAVNHYRELGCPRILRSQWGYNPRLIIRDQIPPDIDVSFVGQVHSRRLAMIDDLRKKGIVVRCWGRGWESGRLDAAAMAETFARSRINLNFSESWISAGWKPWAKILLNPRADGSYRLNSPSLAFAHLQTLLSRRSPQIKARNFEVPASGGFLLTSPADDLDSYFTPGKQIVLFSDEQDLAEKIRYYLSHDDERERIRSAGTRRAVSDHSYDQRFRILLGQMGFDLTPEDSMNTGNQKRFRPDVTGSDSRSNLSGDERLHSLRAGF